MGKIFFNYRRDDDPGNMGRVYDRLVPEFGAARLFMDLEGDIPLGEDYFEVLRAEVANCDVLLAIIGPRWLQAVDEHGRRRIDDPEDWVRKEIIGAFLAGKRVIPVLVGGAEMMRAEVLPDPLKPLVRRQAISIRLVSFKSDVQRLIDAIRVAIAELEKDRAASEAERRADTRQGRPRVALSGAQGKYILAIVSNERVLHINRAKDGFYEEFRRSVDGHRLIDEVGSANNNAEGDEINDRAFERVFSFSRAAYGRDPNILVTVGTQVSIHAARYRGNCPRFFLAVSDPVASGLIAPDEAVSRAGAVAGFSNGIDRMVMLEQLSLYFPGRTFAFVYGEDQPQDIQMLSFLQSPQARAAAPITAFVKADSAHPLLDRSMLTGRELIFGWNLLSTNIDRFIAANRDLPFIAQHIEHGESEAIASFGLDFRELGAAAARFLVEEHLENKRPLGDLPIDFSHRMQWHFNSEQMVRFGIEPARS